MEEIKYKPIGIIHSPFKKPEGVPIQSIVAKGISGKVEIFPEYVDEYDLKQDLFIPNEPLVKSE